MEGPPGVALQDGEASLGMIPRSVLQIFQAAHSLKEKGWEYRMEAQYLEIYNESLRDLLAGEVGGEDGGDASKTGKLDIKHHPTSGRTTVTDACVIEVTSAGDVFRLLRRASRNRAVAATECNERSSRSHSVFTLRLEGRNPTTDATSSGILNLIDLAGSERLAVSKSTGDRLKETQAINKSLSSLGDVIMALANRDAHIPYRNSKLTYLLQNSLGGNSKTLMFVNVAPELASFNESISSLRFATKVNACTIGTATKRVKG
jgi:kinesin family member C1